MATFIDTTTQAPSEPLSPPNKTTPSRWWHRLALAGVMLISLFMNFYQLGQNGFGNLYYAAGVRSMLDNLHNFFFVSFDPGGFVTLTSLLWASGCRCSAPKSSASRLSACFYPRRWPVCSRCC